MKKITYPSVMVISLPAAEMFFKDKNDYWNFTYAFLRILSSNILHLTIFQTQFLMTFPDAIVLPSFPLI